MQILLTVIETKRISYGKIQTLKAFLVSINGQSIKSNNYQINLFNDVEIDSACCETSCMTSQFLLNLYANEDDAI